MVPLPSNSHLPAHKMHHLVIQEVSEKTGLLHVESTVDVVGAFERNDRALPGEEGRSTNSSNVKVDDESKSSQWSMSQRNIR